METIVFHVPLAPKGTWNHRFPCAFGVQRHMENADSRRKDDRTRERPTAPWGFPGNPEGRSRVLDSGVRTAVALAKIGIPEGRLQRDVPADIGIFVCHCGITADCGITLLSIGILHYAEARIVGLQTL